MGNYENDINGLRIAQDVIMQNYDPENNAEMHDLWCTLEHMISDLYDQMEDCD